MDIFDTRMKLTLTDLIDVVARHEKEIQKLKQWVTMQQTPTKIVGPNLVNVLNAAGFYKKEAWVGLTDEEKQIAYRKIDTWDACVSFIEARLKDKNRSL